MKDWRIGKILPWFIVAAGIGLRIAEYVRDRAFWGDEVAVALNLRFRAFAELLHPLSYDQTMPVGLLLGIKSFARVFGYSELALRLPLLLSGCALLILTWVLFSRVFEARVVMLMVAAMAISQPLIYYSAELKQYELDALITVLVAWLAVTTLKNPTNQGWPRLIAAGAAALFFSQPVLFVLASIGIAAVLDRRFRSSGSWRKYCVLAGAVWLIVFDMLLWFSYRSTMQSQYMRAFWATTFATPGAPDFRDRLSHSVDLLLGSLHIVNLRAIILGVLFLIGVYAVAKKWGMQIAVMAGLPFGLVLLASVFKQYPVVTRLALFSVPLLLLIYASGIALLADIVPQRYSSLAFFVLSCALLLPTAVATARQTLHFNQREATRDLVKLISTRNQGGAVYLVFGRYLEWAYYYGEWSQPELLKQRIDLAYACLRAAQLNYVGANEAGGGGCLDLDFPATDQRMEQIVGNPPPSPADGTQADAAWAKREAARIAGAKAKSVWLFLPVYNTNAMTGFPKQRQLLEKLESQLGELGCRPVETQVKGDSLAHNFQCPSPAL